jgi:hypothetical protein
VVTNGITGRALFDQIKGDSDTLAWVMAYGAKHGYARRLIDWSPVMASRARKEHP